jgi:hypothetical protein
MCVCERRDRIGYERERERGRERRDRRDRRGYV